jgi:hypothetical protein
MTVPEVHTWFIALHHRTNRGDYARHVEVVGVWLRGNAERLLRGESDDWIAVGIAPTNLAATELIDRFQEDMER